MYINSFCDWNSSMYESHHYHIGQILEILTVNHMTTGAQVSK